MIALQTVPITVEVTETTALLDSRQSAIAQFLQERLASRSWRADGLEGPRVLIQISALGVSRIVDDLPTDWFGMAIYPIRMHFSTLILGPLCHAIGRGGPCPCCLERRWLSNRHPEEQDALRSFQSAWSIGSHAPVLPEVCEIIWSIVEADLYRSEESGANPTLANFYALDLNTLRTARYQLVADSRCPACHRREKQVSRAQAIELQACPKSDLSQYRQVDALTYDLPLKAYINPLCGMLGGTVEPDPYHTITAPAGGTFYLQGKYGSHKVWWGGHTTSFERSKRIGLLEALERYSGHWPQPHKIAVVDSYENLQQQALDPRQCGLYTPSAYEENAKLEPFSPQRQMAWVWGYSFKQGRSILVPEQLAYYAAQNTPPPLFVYECSNGCAIGSSLAEAIFYGLLELVERDNFLIHWYAKLAPRQIDPWSSHNRKTLQLLDRVERQGFDTYFFDTRLDIPFPTVTAMAVRRDKGPGTLQLAAGAGLDPEEAIRGALCELAAYIASMPDRVIRELDTLKAMASDYTKVTHLEHHALLYGLPEMLAEASFFFRHPSRLSIDEAYRQWNEERPRNDDLRLDLQYCIDEITKRDMDVIVVEQTLPELAGSGLKVACVIVPGLVPIDFGWGRYRVVGLPRMRTVPRTAGYQATDFDLALLNTAPHPFP